ncbi:MAG: sulfatase [Phycisphaeraceae bacterium]
MPNIILLVGEDVGRHLHCYGDAYASTPNLDRLASEGHRYTHAFSTAPVCAPSRSCLVTGRYAFSMGSHHMRSTLLEPPRLFTHELRDAGWHVNWHTKTDFNFEPPGDFADERSDWLEALRTGGLPEKPCLLFRNFGVTHESTMWPEPWNDAGAVRERVANAHRLAPEQRHDPAKARVPAYLPDTPEVRADIARYYDALSIQDAQVGEVLDALDASPYRDDTIVIYMSDHGRGLWREKRWCYGSGIHLPLLVRAPDVTQAGAVVDELVSWVDIAPTLLSLAGVGVPAGYQGRVFLGPGRGEPREHVFAGRDRMDEAFDRVRVCRSRRWHYIRNYHPELPWAQRMRYMEHQLTTQAVRERHARGELPEAAQPWLARTKPAEELYDAEADPDMVRNLASDPAHAKVVRDHAAALDRFLAEAGDLGDVPETELIARGIVADQLDEYRGRIEPLPERYRIGPEQTLVTIEDVRQWAEAGAGE